MKSSKAILPIVISISLFLGLFIHHESPANYIWKKISIFEAIFGFIGCLMLIFFAKALGRFLLERDEDYYD